MKQPEEMENGVDDTVFLQEVLPCKSSEQKVHPHRKDENKYYEAGLVYISSGEDHCQRIGKDQADHCADKCKQKCKPQSLIFSGVVILARFIQVNFPSLSVRHNRRS